MNCKDKIKGIIQGKEAELLCSLFQRLGRKCPQGKKIGVINDAIALGGNDCSVQQCAHQYSWGFSKYCDNEAVLQHYEFDVSQKH